MIHKISSDINVFNILLQNIKLYFSNGRLFKLAFCRSFSAIFLFFSIPHIPKML